MTFDHDEDDIGKATALASASRPRIPEGVLLEAELDAIAAG